MNNAILEKEISYYMRREYNTQTGQNWINLFMLNERRAARSEIANKFRGTQ